MAAFVSAGCSARQIADGGGAEGEDDLARLAAAICERQATCDCGEWVGIDLEPEACRALHYEGLLRWAELAAEAEDYEPDEACLRELADCWEQLQCGQSPDDAVLCAPSCAAHHLNLGVGGTCDDGPQRPRGFVQQCEPGLECLGGHGYAVCDIPEPLQLGERCFDAALHRSCAPDLYCAGQETGDGRCQPRLGQGSDCETATMCMPGLRCADGTCAPLAPPGADCERDRDCESGSTCHPTQAVCARPAEVGEVCRFPNEHGIDILPCAEGTWCGDPLCEPMLELGSPCVYSDGCPAQSACEDGRCTACPNGSCSDPVCAELPLPYAYPTGD